MNWQFALAAILLDERAKVFQNSMSPARRPTKHLTKKLIYTTPIVLAFAALTLKQANATPTCNADFTRCTAASASKEDVADAIAAIQENGLVIVPPGVVNWNSRLDITKGITLQGQTTITGTDPSTYVPNDQTVIVDENPDRSGANSGLIRVTLTPTQSGRITGITLRGGTITAADQNGSLRLSSTGNAPQKSIRVDHCHFDHLYDKAILTSGWVLGLADHNFFEATGAGQTLNVNCPLYGNSTDGNGSWADYPYFGSDNFFFLEDSYISGTGANTTSGAIDSSNGGRYVTRHNYFFNARPGGHGTEGGIPRGMRATESYDNVLDWTIAPSAELRSGSHVRHDNTWLHVPPQGDIEARLVAYRQIGAVGVNPGFGWATGNNPWDVNDPHGLYISGVAQGASVVTGSQATFSVGGGLTPHAYQGMQVSNTNEMAACFGHSSYIIDNDASTITYYYYASGDRGPAMLFAVNDGFAVYNCLVSIDQPGRGKGDLTCSTCTPQQWPNQQQEPCLAWNDVASNGHYLGFFSSLPTVIAGQDYINYTTPFPPDTIPFEVQQIYTAQKNSGGVFAYDHEFQYPHPLQGATTNTVTPTTSTANGTSYTSNAFIPVAGDLIIVLVSAAEGASQTTSRTVTDSQNLGFTLIDSKRSTGPRTSYLFVSNNFALATSMTVTFTTGGDQDTGAVVQIMRVSGMSRKGPQAVLQFAHAIALGSTPPQVSFSLPAHSGNPTIGIVTNSSNPAALTPPSGWTEDSGTDTGFTQPNTGSEIVYRNSGFSGTTITWGSTSATNWVGIIAELDTSAAP